MTSSFALRAIRITCAFLFVASIAGLIISSIAGNNAGWVISIGLVAVTAAVVLIVASLVASHQRIPAFSEARAEEVERIVTRLVQKGADEADVRELVRASVHLGRGL
jgi:c-di-AMP phosphodiesterase-like protein